MAKTGAIVIVEDDEDDKELLEEVLREMKLPNKILFFNKALKAFEYLRSTIESPFLIISDVNLPGMSGLELKKQIDSEEYLRKKCIPFVFLSTSSNISCVKKAYEEMTIQGYFEKPLLIKELRNLLHCIIGYWKLSNRPY